MWFDITICFREVFEQATTSQANRSTETTKVSQILEVLVKQHEQLQEKLKIGLFFKFCLPAIIGMT